MIIINRRGEIDNHAMLEIEKEGECARARGLHIKRLAEYHLSSASKEAADIYHSVWLYSHNQ